MTFRLLILSTIPLLVCIAAGLGLGGWLMLRKFNRSHTSISNQSEMADLKRVVKDNMLLALYMIALFALIAILGFGGAVCGYIEWIELQALSFFVVAVFLVQSIVIKRAERRVRNLAVDDETLREEFDHVIKRWRSSILPDW